MSTAEESARDHVAVLQDEVLNALSIKPAGIYVDATFGRGGHSGGLLASLGANGHLLALDRDPQAIAVAQAKFADDARFDIHHSAFSMLEPEVGARGWAGKVDGIMFDLGVSSPQLDDPERGFSFVHDGPLDMRMNPTVGESAAQWLAHAKEADIAVVLKEYGEERYARRIARAIVKARLSAPIETTGRLSEIVKVANPAWEKNKHPATRSFQAIRIFINRELDELMEGLSQAVDVLADGGRIAVISFHSLEDRIVKRFFRRQVRGIEYPKEIPITYTDCQARLRLVGKAVFPGAAEIARNPRARSAVLRIAEKNGNA